MTAAGPRIIGLPPVYSPDFVEDTVGVLQLHSEDQIQGLWEINFILPIFMAPLYIIILMGYKP